MSKAAFSRNKALFTSKLDLNRRKNGVKGYISSIAFYGAETWTDQKEDQKYLKCGDQEGWRSLAGPIV
jgi:hypothetical protein